LLARILFLILATLKKLSRALSVILIIAATLLVYWPALRNGFVWDDTALVLRDPLIRSWRLIPEGFRHFLFLDATAANFYRPIQRLSFVADYQFYGFAWPGGWHLTSVLIHAGAAVGLFYVAEKLLALALATRLGETARRIWALGVAVLWAIHPLHTSAVTYIAGRADPLAALFGFTALALGLMSLDGPKRMWLWRSGAAAGFALAILSKESGGTFLLIWLLVLLWRRPNWRDLASWAALLALVVGGYCALRFTAHQTPPPPPPPTPVAIRPILAARAFAEYSALLVAPVSLRMERDVSTKPRESYEATLQNARLREYQTLGGVLLLLGFAAWVRFSWRHAPVAAFCLGAFALAYLPISNAFSLNATIAEHWLYVPSAFLFLAIALTSLVSGEAKAGHPTRASAPLRYFLTALAFAWIGALGVRTFLRQGDWHDQRTFVERTIASGGNSARMLMNLANVESQEAHPERAVALYQEALRRTPEQPIIWLGYANTLMTKRDIPGAREALAHAEVSPFLQAECAQLRTELDFFEHGTDRREGMRTAAQLAPANWNIRKRYIETLAHSGDIAGARHELLGFLERESFRASSWNLLGQLLSEEHDFPRARVAFQEALARDVHDKNSHDALMGGPVPASP
jgi:tetratricopeptide (TPR) repeat protein